MYRTLLPNTGYNTLFTSHNWVHTKKVLMQRGRQVSRWRLSSNQIKYALHPPPFGFWRPPSPHRSRTSSLKIMLQATLSYYSEQGRLIGLIRRRLDEDHKWATAIFHSKVPVLSEKREKIQEIQHVCDLFWSVQWTNRGWFFFPLLSVWEKSFSWQPKTKIIALRGWEFTGNNVFHQIAK